MHVCNTINSLNIRRVEYEEKYEEKNKKIVTRRKDQKTKKRIKQKS